MRQRPRFLELKRAKADQIALGTPGDHYARLAQIVDLPAPTLSIQNPLAR